MTRLCVVDQSGLEPGGHYYAYTSCVVTGARQLGLDTVVLANKRFHTARGSELGVVVPCFTYTWTEAELDGKLDWEQGNIAFEMFEAFRRVPLSVDDHVFLHTLGYRELRALLSFLTTRPLPGDPIPYFHILLRRDPNFLIDNFSQYAGYFAAIAASEYLQEKIAFHADTDLLAETFADFCRVPFATAPIPLDQTLLLGSLAAHAPRSAGDPLTVVYLGDAREEKGFQHLPQALSYLLNDYIANERVRLVLQSNFNTPGGEPGILAASQNLAGFPATILKSAPLAPAEYYRILADADIVLIPYSPQRYRYRSSGVLIEAMAAGKVVVTSAGSWMATQVTPERAVLFDNPAGIGPAVAEAIDRFDALSSGAQAHREAALAHATGINLVRHLLTRSQLAARPARPKHRRVLLVMNGDAMVLNNGASQVARGQLQYLTAAGYDIVGLFLTGDEHDSHEALAWRAALGRSIASFRLERVFVAGTAGGAFDPDQTPTIRDQRRQSASPISAEFDFASAFAFGGALLTFLRDHPIDAVLLNYITNYPVIDSLGLDGVPVICEMHDLQSFRRAIDGQRQVDTADLDEEFKWLSRCAALISLNAREAAIARERLPDSLTETTGVFLPTPLPPLPCLAGAKDLAEIVSSAGPLLQEYQSEAARQTGNVDFVHRLIDVGFVDVLYVSSARVPNVSGLKWFLSEVYEPYLSRHQVSMIVAGSICRAGPWPRFPRIFFIDQVENLAPLYAAARVVVLPITEGAESSVKTVEALVHGRPIVGTSHAFRGLEGDLGALIVRDDPEGFADAILTLVNSPEERNWAAECARNVAVRHNDYNRYFATMDRVFARALGNRADATHPPPPREHEPPQVEWSSRLQALNRIVRSYLESEPLEYWALELLAKDNQEDLATLIDGVSRSLLEDRSAAVLRTEHRLKRHIVTKVGPRAREDMVFAIHLALADHGAMLTTRPKSDSTARIVAYGGLPLKIAGAVKEPDAAASPIVVDGRAIATKRVSDGMRYPGRFELFQAEIAALEGDNMGLRAIEVSTAAGDRDGASPQTIAVLQHSVPISSGLRLLGRDAFDNGFEMWGAGAQLSPAATGVLSVPRVADGQNTAYVDLCFVRSDADALTPTSSPPAAPAPTIMLNGRPAETELINSGLLTLARVLLGVRGDFGDFGIVPLTIVNNDHSAPLCLVAVHSGLLFGSIGEASRIATFLALAGQRLDQASSPNSAKLARDAVATIIRGAPLAGPAVGALSALATSSTGQQTLKVLAAEELSRTVRQTGATRRTANDLDTVVEDLYAIVASCLGTSDDTSAVVCPALPFDIVDEAGQPQRALTETALRQRGGSWRVLKSLGLTQERIRIRLDATLHAIDHPGVIEFSGFYYTEGSETPYRWTGPERISTITIPVALSGPAHLVIELGSTGKNDTTGDFTISCNDRVVSHILKTDDRGVTLTARLPAFRFAGPSTNIALRVNECSTPGPSDSRTLGVVFRSLSLILSVQDETESATQAPVTSLIKSEEPVELQPTGVSAAGDSVPLPRSAAGRRRSQPHRGNGGRRS